MMNREESELFEEDSVCSDELQNHMKFLQGGFKRLCESKVQTEAKLASMEELLRSVMKSVDRWEIHAGKQVEGQGTSRQSFQGPIASDLPSSEGRVASLPLETRESLIQKIRMPVFNGTQAYAWISQVERFFRVGRFGDAAKLDLVSLSLEGDVLKWFNWEVSRLEFQSWDEFKQRLLIRFGETIDDEPGNRLFAIRQVGTVAEYVTEFQDLSAQVAGLDDSHLEKIFYNGLKHEMKEVIKMKEPKGLPNHIAAVLKMESSSFCRLVSDKGKSEQLVSKPIPQPTRPVFTSNAPKPVWTPHGSVPSKTAETSSKPTQ